MMEFKNIKMITPTHAFSKNTKITNQSSRTSVSWGIGKATCEG
jgi:hypothetical protein